MSQWQGVRANLIIRDEIQESRAIYANAQVAHPWPDRGTQVTIGPGVPAVYSIYSSTGHRWEPIQQRFWRGEDGSYFNFALDENDKPPTVHEEIHLYLPGQRPQPFVVREVEYKGAEDWVWINTVDRAYFLKRYKIDVEPGIAPIMDVPKFDSVEEAEKWLAEKDKPRQLYPDGSVVTWMRKVPWPEQNHGLVVPEGMVEYAGKVVSWKPEWRLARYTDMRPHYQLLTQAWQSDDMELVWVPADEILGMEV